MPVPQGVDGQQPGRRVVRIDDDEVIERIGQIGTLEVGLVQRSDGVPRLCEGWRVFAVAERGDADASRAQQSRQENLGPPMAP